MGQITINGEIYGTNSTVDILDKNNRVLQEVLDESNVIHKEITQEEYNKLENAENDGILYFITDGMSEEAYDFNKNLAEAFDDTKTYSIGDLCIFNNQLYEFTYEKPAGSWDENVASIVTMGFIVRKIKGAINGDVLNSYLPLTGGTLTDNLVIKKSEYPGVRCNETTNNSGAVFQAWGQSAAMYAYNTFGNTNIRRALHLRTSSHKDNPKLKDALVLRDQTGPSTSESSYYHIYGEHNMKPTAFLFDNVNSNFTVDNNNTKYIPFTRQVYIDYAVKMTSSSMEPGKVVRIATVPEQYRPASDIALSCVICETDSSVATGVYQAFLDYASGNIYLVSKTGTFNTSSLKPTFSINGSYIHKQ